MFFHAYFAQILSSGLPGLLKLAARGRAGVAQRAGGLAVLRQEVKNVIFCPSHIIK